MKYLSERAIVLRIGSSYGPATSVPSLVATFKRQYPTTEIQLRILSSPDIKELVKNSELDLGVVTNPTPVDSLQMEPFKTFQISFFASSAHPLARSKVVSVEMLAKYPLVIGRAKKARGRAEELLSSMASNGVKLDVFMRCQWPDAVKTVVREGEAIEVLYRDSIEQGVRAGDFKILNVAGVNLSVISYILYSAEKALSETAQEFRRMLRTKTNDSTTGSLLQTARHNLLLLFTAVATIFDFVFAM